MVSTYTTRNRIEKPGLGDFKNTWGDEVNVNMDLADFALDGSVSKSATATLTTANGATDEARARTLIFTGASNSTFVLPALEKWYIVRNAGTAKLTVWVGSGTAVVIPQGTTAQVYTNGTDCFLISGRRPWVLIQSQATTSGTSKTFSSLNLNYFDELILRFDGVSHSGAGSVDLRIGIQTSPTAYFVLGNFAAAATVYGAIRISGGTYASDTETGYGGCMSGGVANLAAAEVGTAGGVSIPFRADQLTAIVVDFGGVEAFDAGALKLYGK